MELWPHRLAVRTPGSHPGNRGSIPREVTKNILAEFSVFFIYDLSLAICLTTSMRLRGVMSALIR